MLTFNVFVMLAVVPFVLFAVFAGINGPPSSVYEKGASDRAMSVLHETGKLPERVMVIGRETVVKADELDVSTVRRSIEENRQWRKAMIEQAMVNTCITMLVKCGRDDVGLLWSFMPNRNGPVSEILTGSISPDLDCVSATDADYARYGRSLFMGAISEEMLSEAVGGGVMNYHYSKPAGGVGCSFYDMVDLRWG